MTIFSHRKNIVLCLLFLFVLFSLLTACHSKYIFTGIDTCWSPAWNNAKTAVAFMTVKMVYRPASGIAKFPDGGTVEIEYQDIGLYYFNLEDNKLVKVDSFTELTPWANTWKSNYKADIAFTDTLIYYKIKPKMWRLKKQAEKGPDALKARALIEKYSKCYAYDIKDHKISEVDPELFNKLFNQTKKLNKISYNRLNSLLKEVSLSDWGIVLKDIYPQSDQDYIEYIVYNQGSGRVQDWIMGQVIPTFSKKKIKGMLKEMETYKIKLEKKDKSSYNDHVRKINYDKYYEPVRKKLMEFL